MQDKATPEFYRVKDVAARYDVSPSTIYRAIEAGKIDALKFGNALRIPAYALRAYEEECGEAAYQAYVVGGAPADTDDDSTGDDEAVKVGA